MLEYINTILDNIRLSFRYYTAIKELHDLSDRELADLGLTRYDINFVVYKAMIE